MGWDWTVIPEQSAYKSHRRAVLTNIWIWIMNQHKISHLHQQHHWKPVVLPLSLVALFPIEARSWRAKSISSSTTLEEKYYNHCLMVGTELHVSGPRSRCWGTGGNTSSEYRGKLALNFSFSCFILVLYSLLSFLLYSLL